MNKPKNRFFTNHAKSSAAFVSIAIHALLIVVAVSFVAVTVIKKEDQKFENKPVKRPKMHLKKLQVPVTIKKKKQMKPKLRKRIVAVPKLSQTMPDIKMPEISGIKGGLGGAGVGGLGGAGGIGFSMPEIDVFGVKSKGEKVFLILDSSPEIMKNELGGIPAYTLIKEELIRIIDGLNAATLFNVVVFESSKTYQLFPSLVSASSANVAHVEKWLTPLNAVRPGMGAKEYGGSTLGKGGSPRTEDLRRAKFSTLNYKWQELWYRPAMIAMQQQADTIFILTSDWRYQRAPKKEMDNTKWNQSAAGRTWAESFEKGKIMLAEENKKLAEQGKPPRVINRDPYTFAGVYFPEIERPPQPEWYWFTPRDFVQALMETREEHRSASIQTKSGLTKKKKAKLDFSLNVIQFVEEGGAATARSEENFKKLTSLCKGEYKTIAGLEAIQSSVGSQSSD